jgi:hypothetical protein
VIQGLAHTAVCVPDVEAAVAWYRDVLRLHVLSPPPSCKAKRSSATWETSSLIRRSRPTSCTDIDATHTELVPWGVILLLIEKTDPTARISRSGDERRSVRVATIPKLIGHSSRRAP